MEVPYKEILTWGLTLLSGYLMLRLQSQRDRIKSIENQLSEKKYKMYSELIYIFFDITNSKKIDQEEVERRLLNIKRDLFLYAPDIIFTKFTDWVLSMEGSENPTLHFKKYYELMTLIRKEMGYRKTKLTIDDFMLFYMQSRLEYEKFKKQNNW